MQLPNDRRPTDAEPWLTRPDHWLAAIVESSEDAIVGKTLDSVIRSWNAGATRIFGYQAEEIVGRSVLTLIPPDRQNEERTIVDRLSRGERVEIFETVRVRKDGSCVDVALSVSPIRDDAGVIVGAAKIARDVTEAKRLRNAEHELAKALQEQAAELEQQIEEAQALHDELEHTNDELQRAITRSQLAQEAAERANRAKSLFLATMSHELRTPLNAIAGYVDLMDLGIDGPMTPQQYAHLERIRVNQRTLLRLIEDVLDMAKLESGRVEYRVTEFRINDLLRTLETFVAPTLQAKRLDYHFDACDPEIRGRAGRGKAEQVMLNLLSNAVKFTDRGRVEVRCATRDHRVEISIVDTGPGIRPELLETIFEPFVQGDQELTRSAMGTGLGLAISRQLARGMGGEVLASSQPGKGSSFTLVLPSANPSA